MAIETSTSYGDGFTNGERTTGEQRLREEETRKNMYYGSFEVTREEAGGKMGDRNKEGRRDFGNESSSTRKSERASEKGMY